jgi:uncharacterized protein YbjT (DUF2867 family)
VWRPLNPNYPRSKAFKAAVAGHARLFLLTNDNSVEPGLARIAAEAGIKQIVKISCIGAATTAEPGTVFYKQGVAEREVAAAAPGVGLVVLRPSDFMENLLNQVRLRYGLNI